MFPADIPVQTVDVLLCQQSYMLHQACDHHYNFTTMYH